MSKISSIWGMEPLKGFQIGVEFELESIQDTNASRLQERGISAVPDNSLRNSGVEFITTPTGDIPSVVDIHKTLLNDSNTVLYKKKAEACTERCSTHVHVNMTDLEEDTVDNLILLYYLLEPLFYHFVEPHRRHNIYCVPISWTSLPKHLKRLPIPTLHSKWSKYTGFNILPLTELGTIEFRHMEATYSTEKFRHWLEIIFNWYNYGCKNKLTLESLEDVNSIVNAVFPVEFLPKENLNSYLENQILDLKLAFIKPDNRWK